MTKNENGMSKHTPWPLTFRDNVDVKKRMLFPQEVFDSNGRRVLITCVQGDFARRIVACVNAHEGVSTKALEEGAISIARGALLTALDMASGAADDITPFVRDALAKLEGK